MPASKIPDYIAHRLAGCDPTAAGLAAGYSMAGLAVTICNLEKRDDVKSALRKGKKAKALKPLKSPSSNRQYRSVAHEPRHGDGPAEDDSILNPWKLKDKYDSPLDLLKDVMNNPKAPGGLRIQCAKDALPYCHARKEGSKKEDDKTKAKQTAGTSKFGSVPKPGSGLRLAA